MNCQAPGCSRLAAACGYCQPCYKRLIWRPRNAAAVEREREASRKWKREHLGQPGRAMDESARVRAMEAGRQRAAMCCRECGAEMVAKTERGLCGFCVIECVAI